MEDFRNFFTWSAGIFQITGIHSFLGGPVYLVRTWQPRFRLNGTWVGWGHKPGPLRIKDLAHIQGQPFQALEDGFLRSYGMGRFFSPLSLIVDDVGIHYDCFKKSRLEALLQSTSNVLTGHESSIASSRMLLRIHALSKYNHVPERHWQSSDSAHPDYRPLRALVVDQTFGDNSIALGGANAKTFAQMLATARAENPQATVYIKTHPEVTSGRKRGYLTHIQSDDHTVVLREAVNPMSLLPYMDKVYVVTSTLGFEALLAGKPVVCFGVPWYAGWGVTDDRCVDSPAWARRTRRRTVDELFAAAYIHYTRYLDPVTHQRGTITDVIEWLVRQKEMATRMHGPQRTGRVIGVGLRRWKAAHLKAPLGLHPDRVMFVPSPRALTTLALQKTDTVVCWGALPPASLTECAREAQARLLHVEDGFIRSVGLGSDLIRPQSLIFDERGIYFDATRPSDLEVMLATRSFTDDDLARAQKVRAFIVEHGITKYNLEPRNPPAWPLPADAGRRPVILVPGQVEDDASIRLGCTTVRTNLALLQAVRAAHPQAYIVYKPHPDVASGNRRGRLALRQALQWVDHVETDAGVIGCMDACDEVHTMTSLAGFDALLRGKRVVTYGQPFYAGWGVTEDRADNPTAFARRTRRLTLDELVAGTLLYYPIYWDWDLKGYTNCEAVLHRIVEQRSALEARGDLHTLRAGWLRRQWRKLDALARAWLQSP